uniref:Uncharacterized protein n=1 Tax=Arundo donax TaxID=35708 RepID=A0A0A8YBS1_ARUDO
MWNSYLMLQLHSVLCFSKLHFISALSY